ncbi:putative glycine C-acetyltransferase [Cardiosporidium cionae]|uniref:serine C-palmitoyltransferase n=1 Tax=Cardiosporidium cionae TaxID=476202 RepID=A0ABQ7J6R5_9APIC|nr:putative glycine C-acetyltransferase [Cardiosporidium cionae]|eukprot:KAF8819648.1 putative glycine C-acetyltransferase [Cardiosporidium cionae]
MPTISSTDLTAANFSSFHYCVTAVAAVGIILALFSEDAALGSLRLSWIANEFLPMPQTKLHSKDLEQTWKRVLNGTSLYQSIVLLLAEISAAAASGQILHLLHSKYSKILSMVRFYFDLIALKRAATSQQHVLYLLEKKIHNLEIKKGESEMTSYLDAKRHMKEKKVWPFMLDVTCVKEKHVMCNGMRALTMSSYSYLNFIREMEVQEAAIAAAREYSTGNHGPRMLGGSSKILRDLELSVGKFFGREDSLIFATGYLACMSGVSAVCRKNDLILCDNRIHASLRVGVKISGGKYLNFRHNDFHHCRKLLEKNRKKYSQCWIIIESVYSMDGDIADLPSAYELTQEYDCKIILDEAHGLGVLGKTGRGIEEHFNMVGTCEMIVGTFSKSIGGIGGYITGSEDLVEFLDFHTAGNLFSAPLTAYSAGGALKALEIILRDPWRVSKLKENISYFRGVIGSSDYLWPKDYPEKNKFLMEGCSESAVIPVIFPGGLDRVFRLSLRMLELGFMVAPVGFPACPLDKPRLRVTATAGHEKADMDNFVVALVRAAVDCKPGKADFGM